MTREPLFIDAEDRRLFAILHGASGGGAPTHTVVWFSPFAEEMNRSRRMATLLGERLAANGIALLVFDYSGTGDSGGEFADARWEDWIADGNAACRWARDRLGGRITAVGLRLGVHIAMQCAERDPGLIERLVFWQPVATGKTFLTQFLRQRTVAALSAGREGESTEQLFRMLEAGETVEVAGYELTGGMADKIGALRLGDTPPPKPPVHWMELSSTGALSPATSNIVDRWQETGARIHTTALEGPAFWSIQETTTAPALIETTAAALEGDA